jgi:hypothetical protein
MATYWQQTPLLLQKNLKVQRLFYNNLTPWVSGNEFSVKGDILNTTFLLSA